MHDIKLIALDLDGTLLNSNKELPRENYEALEKAAAAGIEIVPCTGRVYSAMPEVVRNLPFVNYIILVNGAKILHVPTGEAVTKAEIPMEQAVEIMEFIDTLPVIYDCFMDDTAYMTKALQDRAEEFAPDIHYLKMIREVRKPVPELKAHLRQLNHGVQKIQFFTKDVDLRARMLKEMEPMFPGTLVTTSVVNNVEINHADANKGEAIRRLAAHLGLDISQTMSFGDALNDMLLVSSAGIGVAMANGHPDVKAQADYVTLSCDENGVAAGIRKFCPQLFE